MRRWRELATVALAVPALTVAAALTTVTPATPVSAYGPGLFAFTQTTDRGFSYHVYVSNTGGTERRLVTTRRAVGRPAFSPDGRRLAFSGPLSDDSDGRYGIYVVNLDGTGLRLLTAPRFADFDPAWSPDGRVIAFSRNVNGNGRLSCCAIALMYADGSSQHLVPGTTYGVHPAWSPDSARLTYAAYDGLHAVNTNGSGHAVLVRGTVSWPAWSPDGSRIAYVRAGGSSSQVQVVPAAGGTPVAVESVAAFAESPAWGVDGRTLYYVLFHGYGDEGRTDSSVWRSMPGAGPGRLFSYGAGLPANVYGLAYFGGPLQLPAKPSAVSWGTGRLDVFVRGTDSALYHKYSTGGSWSDWASLGGTLTGNPEAVSWANGRLDVFVRGSNAALYHKYFAGGRWSDWESLGGALTGKPEVVSWGSGRLDVFVRGTNAALYHRAYSGGWSTWQSLGGVLTGDPDAVSWANGRLDVFVRGTNSALYHRYYAGAGWPAWENLGGILTSDPAAASRGPGILDVAVRGANGSLYVDTYDAGWSGFRGFGGYLGGSPDATSTERGSVDIAASGSPPYPPLLHLRVQQGGSDPLDQHEGPLGGMPETASRAAGVLDVFYRGSDGRLRHRSYDGRSWSPVQDLGGLLPPY